MIHISQVVEMMELQSGASYDAQRLVYVANGYVITGVGLRARRVQRLPPRHRVTPPLILSPQKHNWCFKELSLEL